MKKYLLLAAAVLLLTLAACTPDIVSAGGVVVRGETPAATAGADDPESLTDEEIVYVTKSGGKYHTAGCSHLSESSIPVTLEQAVAEGKAPCSHCH